MPFTVGDPNINLNGRPKGSKGFTTKVREALMKIADGESTTKEEQFIKAILDKAIVDKDSSTQKLIWNYLDGLPQASLDLTSMGKEIFTNEERDNAKNAIKDITS